MVKYSLLTFFLSLSFRLVLGLSPTYLACQLQKPIGYPALAGCPEGTLYVSSTDPEANFTGVQEAINSLPQTSNSIILIGEGEYSEMINVTSSAPLTLLGQLDLTTAFIPSGNASQRNIVKIWNNKCVEDDGLQDEQTATLTVTPGTDQPFGSLDFRVYSIDFENRCGPHFRALVTSLTLTNASFYGCTFSSWQDTWYTGYGANTYAVDSIMYGQTDYIFGCGLAWFRSMILANRGCGGGITAWRGEPGESNGVYITDSRIIRSPDIDTTTVTTENCYLGRPWNKYATAVFHNNYMDKSIQPAGFISWSGRGTVPDTTYFAESHSYGPGGNTSARVEQDHILTEEQAQQISIDNIFGDAPPWIDSDYLIGDN